MFDFDALMIDKYTRAQRARYVTPDFHIVFHMHGLEEFRAPDGSVVTSPGAFLMLIPAGTPIDFTFGPDRENWVVQLESSSARQGPSPNEVELRTQEGSWITLQHITPVTPEHISGWEGEFIRMREAHNDPLPISRMRVHAGIWNILRYILDRQPDTLGETPAGHLRRLIREDRRCARNLEALSTECGYSSDHIRRLFVSEYGVTPQQFRNRQRMIHAVELLSNSNLTIKDIARELGFRHVSHFSTLFREAYGMTPSDAIRKQRAHRSES